MILAYSINSCCFSGRVIAEPKIQIASTGTKFATFCILVSNNIYDKATGKYEDTVVFVDCIAFGEKVDFVNENVHKGSKVIVNTQLNQSKYKDKEGRVKRSTIYRVTSIDCADSTPPKWHASNWFS